jgi:hypothetical protein
MSHDTSQTVDLRASVIERFGRVATTPKQDQSIRFRPESTMRLEYDAEAMGSCPPT